MSVDHTYRKLLLVEDDDALRHLLRACLTLNGYHVFEAYNRTGALSVLNAENDIEVSIIDLGLPPLANDIKEGVMLLRDINKIRPSLKAIVLSGQTYNESIEECIRYSAFDFISKPASMNHLLEAVSRAFMFVRAESSLANRGIACLNLHANFSDGIKSLTENVEEKLIRKVLKDTNFNVNRSASLLGMKRESLYYFLKKFDIYRRD